MHSHTTAHTTWAVLVALTATFGCLRADSPEQKMRADDNSQPAKALAEAKLVPVGSTGWAKSSVNAAVFRSNSVVARGNTQYVAFYDGDANVVLAKRTLGTTQWEVRKTPYKGQAQDAHNVICIAVDGSGVLHMAWDLHNQGLHYVKGVTPGSLELGAMQPMTGQHENSVTYPQFYALPDGDLLFLYRDGSSGNGNAMLNRYDVQSRTWHVVQHPLVAGGGQRNAYLNTLAIDSKGDIHLSWVWRDTPDVATNHDICYAFSPNQGKSWQKSNGEKYTLPITITNAEVAYPVPHNSELINQTSMTTDANDHPVVATYWRDPASEVPQYRVVWHDGAKWQMSQVGNRTLPFRLSGGGTKRIPISRPQVVAGKDGAVHVIFRDEERGNGVTVATSRDEGRAQWQLQQLHAASVGLWEPTYDTQLWQRKGWLHLFLQRVGQGDAETLENVPAQDVSILEWTP